MLKLFGGSPYICLLYALCWQKQYINFTSSFTIIHLMFDGYNTLSRYCNNWHTSVRTVDRTFLRHLFWLVRVQISEIYEYHVSKNERQTEFWAPEKTLLDILHLLIQFQEVIYIWLQLTVLLITESSQVSCMNMRLTQTDSNLGFHTEVIISHTIRVSDLNC